MLESQLWYVLIALSGAHTPQPAPLTPLPALRHFAALRPCPNANISLKSTHTPDLRSTAPQASKTLCIR